MAEKQIKWSDLEAQADKPNNLSWNDLESRVGPVEPVKKSLGDSISDLGVSAVKSVVGTPQSMAQIGDIFTNGAVTKGFKNAGVDFRQTQDILNNYYSDGFKQQQQDVSNADGWVNIIKKGVANPSVPLNMIMTSLGPMAAGGAAGKAIKAGALATGLGSEAVVGGAGATGLVKYAPALGEGLSMQGAAEDQYRADNNGELSAKQRFAAGLTGLSGTLINRAGANLSNKLGIGDIDNALVNGMTRDARAGIGRNVGGGALVEGGFEEQMQSIFEKGAENFGNDKPLTEGLGNAGAMGLMAGAPMGAGFGFAQGLHNQKLDAQDAETVRLKSLQDAETVRLKSLQDAEVQKQLQIDEANKQALADGLARKEWEKTNIEYIKTLPPEQQPQALSLFEEQKASYDNGADYTPEANINNLNELKNVKSDLSLAPEQVDNSRVADSFDKQFKLNEHNPLNGMKLSDEMLNRMEQDGGARSDISKIDNSMVSSEFDNQFQPNKSPLDGLKLDNIPNVGLSMPVNGIPNTGSTSPLTTNDGSTFYTGRTIAKSDGTITKETSTDPVKARQELQAEQAKFQKINKERYSNNQPTVQEQLYSLASKPVSSSSATNIAYKLGAITGMEHGMEHVGNDKNGNALFNVFKTDIPLAVSPIVNTPELAPIKSAPQTKTVKAPVQLSPTSSVTSNGNGTATVTDTATGTTKVLEKAPNSVFANAIVNASEKTKSIEVQVQQQQADQNGVNYTAPTGQTKTVNDVVKTENFKEPANTETENKQGFHTPDTWGMSEGQDRPYTIEDRKNDIAGSDANIYPVEAKVTAEDKNSGIPTPPLPDRTNDNDARSKTTEKNLPVDENTSQSVPVHAGTDIPKQTANGRNTNVEKTVKANTFDPEVLQKANQIVLANVSIQNILFNKTVDLRKLMTNSSPAVKYNYKDEEEQARLLDIEESMPQFQGNKREMFASVLKMIDAKSSPEDRLGVKEVYDFFAGGGMWSTALAMARYPRVDTIYIFEFDEERRAKIQEMHSNGYDILNDVNMTFNHTINGVTGTYSIGKLYKTIQADIFSGAIDGKTGDVGENEQLTSFGPFKAMIEGMSETKRSKDVRDRIAKYNLDQLGIDPKNPTDLTLHKKLKIILKSIADIGHSTLSPEQFDAVDKEYPDGSKRQKTDKNGNKRIYKGGKNKGEPRYVFTAESDVIPTKIETNKEILKNNKELRAIAEKDKEQVRILIDGKEVYAGKFLSKIINQHRKANYLALRFQEEGKYVYAQKGLDKNGNKILDKNGKEWNLDVSSLDENYLKSYIEQFQREEFDNSALFVVDPPYYGTTGYGNQTGTLGKGENRRENVQFSKNIWNANGYEKVSEFLESISGLGQSIIYTDEAYPLRAEFDEKTGKKNKNLTDIDHAVTITERINETLQNFTTVPHAIGNGRYEFLGFTNGAENYGRSDGTTGSGNVDGNVRTSTLSRDSGGLKQVNDAGAKGNDVSTSGRVDTRVQDATGRTSEENKVSKRLSVGDSTSSNNSTRIARIALRTALESVQSGLGDAVLNDPNVEILTHEEYEAKYDTTIPRNAKGVTHVETGKVVLFASAINGITNPNEIVGLFAHESVVHAKSLGLYSKEFKGVLDSVERLMNVKGSLMEQSRKKVPSDTPKDDIVEETLSYFLESNPDALLSKNYVAQFMVMAKSLLRKIGFTDGVIGDWANSLSEKEILVMAKKAIIANRVSNRSDQKVMRSEDAYRKELINILGSSHRAFKDLPSKYKNDDAFVKEVLIRNGYALQHLTPEQRADKTFVIEALRGPGQAFQFVNERLQSQISNVMSDKNISSVMATQYLIDQEKKAADEKAMLEKELGVTATQAKPKSAMKKMLSVDWNDKQQVLEEVKKDGLLLKFASKELKNDKEVALEAIKQNRFALLHTSEEIKSEIKVDKTYNRVSAMQYLVDKEKAESDKATLEKELGVTADVAPKKAIKRMLSTSQADKKQQQQKLANAVEFDDGEFTGAKLTDSGDYKGVSGLAKGALSEEMERKFVDRYLPYKKVVQMAKDIGANILENMEFDKKEQLIHAKRQKAIDDLMKEYKSQLNEVLNKAGLTIDQADVYARALTAKDTNAYFKKHNLGVKDGSTRQDSQSGMTDAEANSILAKYAGNADVKAVGDFLLKKSQEIHDARLEAGLITQEQYKQLKAGIPLFIPIIEKDIPFKSNMLYGTAGIHGKQINSPIGEIFRQTASAKVSHIEKELIDSVVAFVEELSNEDTSFAYLYDPADKQSKKPVVSYTDPATGDILYKTVSNAGELNNAFAYKDKGETKYIIFNPDSKLAMNVVDAMNNKDIPDAKGAIDAIAKSIAPITQFISKASTQWNPFFAPINFIRDLMTASLNISGTPLEKSRSKIVLRAIKNVFKVFKALRNIQKGIADNSEIANLIRQFQDAGGTTGYQQSYKTGDEVAEALKGLVQGGPIKKAFEQKHVASFVALIETLNDTLEYSTRLAVFKESLSLGLSVQKSAINGKNMTANFNQRGANTATLSKLFAFFNASIAGSSAMLRTLVERNATGGFNLTKQGKMIVGGLALLGVAQFALLFGAGYDEEDFTKYAKDSNFIIPIGGNKTISFPLPLGFNIIPTTSRTILEALVYGKPLDKGYSLASSIVSSFSPMGATSLEQSLTPTVARPIISLATNEDGLGRRIANTDKNPNQPTAGWTRNKDNASWAGQFVALGLDQISGGVNGVPGTFSPTADQVDYLIGFATGGAGKEVVNIGKTATNVFNGDFDKAIKSAPLARRIYDDKGDSDSKKSRYYTNINKIANFETQLQTLRKDQDFAGASAVIKENKEASLIPVMNNFEKQINNLNKQKRLIKKQDGSDVKVKEIEDRIQARMEQFNILVAKRLGN